MPVLRLAALPARADTAKKVTMVIIGAVGRPPSRSLREIRLAALRQAARQYAPQLSHCPRRPPRGQRSTAAPQEPLSLLAHLFCPSVTRHSKTLALLHEASGGRLRDIDRIATDALKRAARRKLKRVDRKLIASTLDTEQ